MGRGAITRIWREVYEAYKEAAEEHRVALSDLMSVLLIAVVGYSPLTAAWVVMDAFELTPEEALSLVESLRENLRKMREVAEVLRSVEGGREGEEEVQP